MPASSPLLRGLLPEGSTWTPVDDGESDATVLRDSSGSRYAKIVDRAQIDVLAGERDRIEWLSSTGISGPDVLEWRVTEHGASVITSAVVGVPADRLDPPRLRAAWPSISDTLVGLHSIPSATCPYDRTLDAMMALARATVTENRVHSEFLPPHLTGTPPTVILEGLERDVPRRRQQEEADTVVCHGDLCLPNIIIDPETSRVAGLIDVGRLGRADRYADIALLLANARETWPDEEAARGADDDLASRYGIALDADRMDFYLRLDPLTW